MRVQRAQQAQARLGQSDLVIITERVDAVALRLGQRVTMGCVEVLDQHSPQHWKPRGVSGGWTAVIGLASILPDGEPRKVSVEASINGLHHTLRRLSGQRIAPLDCRDDRWGPLLPHGSTPQSGPAIDQDGHVCSRAV